MNVNFALRSTFSLKYVGSAEALRTPIEQEEP